ncbi:MAG TPA: hypothetical protein VKR30_12650 [Candidatus Limnocylindrales bacterium]|nr:hypothetical protein [Candidatus Limnocylindrales bacterium]
MTQLDPARTLRLVARMRWLGERATDRMWAVAHRFGSHRWHDGYETNLERGWTRYRGVRCAVCDEPWEGW